MFRRLGLFLFALLLPVGSGLAQQEQVVRIAGNVSSGNYGAFESFLFNAVDSVIGLKIAFESFDGHRDGAVTASVDDGMFVAYLAGPDGASEIVARQGFSENRGMVVFDGFFVVKPGGMNQGITSIFLDSADEASVLLSGRQIVDMDIDDLPQAE